MRARRSRGRRLSYPLDATALSSRGDCLIILRRLSYLLLTVLSSRDCAIPSQDARAALAREAKDPAAPNTTAAGGTPPLRSLLREVAPLLLEVLPAHHLGLRMADLPSRACNPSLNQKPVL